jgi:hypothetical protein
LIERIVKSAITLLLGGALLLGALWSVEEVRWEAPACPHGVGHGLQDLRFLKDNDAGPASSQAQKLLNRPNFGATSKAAEDLEDGIVDERLVATLLTVTEEHSVCVRSFKEGHRILPGVEDGPRIPEGYGNAGGEINTHYFGRAADIFWVDGKRVQGNGTDPAVLDVGRTLAGIPPDRRPDEIIGPPGWTRSLSYPRAAGWVVSPALLDLHRDHLHIGYGKKTGTYNTR